LAPTATQVRNAALELEDAAFTLRRYVDRLDLDPAELAEVDARLNLVNRIIDKYARRGGSVEDVLAYRAEIEQSLEKLRSAQLDFATIDAQIASARDTLTALGQMLSAARHAAARTLEAKVGEQLRDLGMKEARFAVDFTPLPAGQFAASGLETLEFMIAPNPGQPARPLRRIASGGELSRVMLGLKSILAQADRVSVLVFDEIDANVGGRMGTVIGEKLRALSKAHQVLCITHLPQIAAFADRHITVRKTQTGGQSFTTVEQLTGDARIEELAEMITGKNQTETSLAQARELLAMAEQRVEAAEPAAATGQAAPLADATAGPPGGQRAAAKRKERGVSGQRAGRSTVRQPRGIK
jgi:DNA repair protein RecN (Recombination protein N)